MVVTSSRLPLFLWASLAAMAQTPAPGSDKPIAVQGVVTNSVTGEPVLRAHVVLRSGTQGQQGQASQKRYAALTAVDGKFTITAIDPGRYSVAIDKTGFITTSDVPMMNLQPGDSKDDLKFKLTPCGSIVGRVLTAEGDPVDNAMVVIENYPSNTTTDEKGQYRLGGLAPGKYRIRATIQDIGMLPEIRTDGTKEVHYAPTYHPSALLPESATRVEARAGSETTGIDIRMVRTPIVRISGMVAGLPPGTQDAHIELRKGRSSSSGNNLKADGTFELWKADPGKYIVVATWNTPAGVRIQSTPAEVEVADRDIDRVVLNVLPPIALAGHIQFDDDKARPQQPQVNVRRQGLQAQQTPLQSASQRIMIMSMEGFSSQTANLGADDTFQLNNLSPNRYRLMISWGPAYIKSIRIGSTQVDGNVLDLRQGTPGDSVTIVVSSAMGTISGKVTDDKGPATAASVMLAPDDTESGQGNRFVDVQPDGAYIMPTIPPGKYRIVAIDEAARSQFLRANREDYIDQTEPIEIHANDQITKDLKKK
jgi:hypothetical protein